MAARFVYFDLGNVLVTFDHQTAIEQLARLAACPQALVRQVVFDSDLQKQYETGLVTSDQFAAAVNLGLETNLPALDILEAFSAIFEPNHDILDAFKLVQEAGVPMGILSNTCEAHWKWIAARSWPMLGHEWFEFEVLSYQVQSMKPAARIYEVCEERAGCRGTSIFFTDDRADNIAAAAQRGWATCQFLATDALLHRLRSWLIPNEVRQ